MASHTTQPSANPLRSSHIWLIRPGQVVHEADPECEVVVVLLSTSVQYRVSLHSGRVRYYDEDCTGQTTLATSSAYRRPDTQQTAHTFLRDFPHRLCTTSRPASAFWRSELIRYQQRMVRRQDTGLEALEPEGILHQPWTTEGCLPCRLPTSWVPETMQPHRPHIRLPHLVKSQPHPHRGLILHHGGNNSRKILKKKRKSVRSPLFLR